MKIFNLLIQEILTLIKIFYNIQTDLTVGLLFLKDNMKDTFFNLQPEKKQKIIESCIIEFGKQGYEKGSTDRIIKKAGISKGGLYEYIHSKEELYIYITEYCYSKLYDCVYAGFKNEVNLTNDILERFKLISEIAINFYLDHPQIIEFVGKSNLIQDQRIFYKVQAVFFKKFNSLFEDIKLDELKYEKTKVLDLLSWLLLKTRNDFLEKIKNNKDISEVKKSYFSDWAFFIDILKKGIYKKSF